MIKTKNTILDQDKLDSFPALDLNYLAQELEHVVSNRGVVGFESLHQVLLCVFSSGTTAAVSC